MTLHRTDDDGAIVNVWTSHLRSHPDLWDLASEVGDGVDISKRLTSVRERCIKTMQFFCRVFVINLASTAHMRPEDCSANYKDACFGNALFADQKHSNDDGIHGQEKLAASPPEVDVPGCNGLRDLVWNLKSIL